MTSASQAEELLVALAAVFAPARASALVSRFTAEDAARVADPAARGATAPRAERLAALARSLTRIELPAAEGAVRLVAAGRPGMAERLTAADEGPHARRGAAFARLVRERLASATGRAADGANAGRTAAGAQAADLAEASVGTERETGADMTLPFELPAISDGYARLTPLARELGQRAAEGTSGALATLTGGEVRVTGTARPCRPAPCAGTVRLRIELTALPATAALEVEAALAVALLDRLGGGSGVTSPATDVTPLERAALELAVLACLEAGALPREVEQRLAPRLARSSCEPISGLAVDLSVLLGGRAGRARLVLPPAAVRALGNGSPPAQETDGLPLELSLRGGAAPLLPEELAALEAGDVVLLDPLPPLRLWAVAPGGLRFVGSERDGHLHVEEIRMPCDPSEYPIALEVELARVPVTLGELSRLEPGAVLPLPIDRRGLVTMKIGDRTLGTGQLVDVEGAIGVRVDTLSGARP